MLTNAEIEKMNESLKEYDKLIDQLSNVDLNKIPLKYKMDFMLESNKREQAERELGECVERANNLMKQMIVIEGLVAAQRD